MGLVGQIVVSVALLVGAAFALVASLGILRFPDVLLRMHASTKAGTLGAGLIYVAAALRFGDSASVTFSLLTILFLMATMPVGAHAIGRAAHRACARLWLPGGGVDAAVGMEDDDVSLRREEVDRHR